MSAAAFCFQLFWSVPELRGDLAILFRCGRVQEQALAAGSDSPAGWFLQAAQAYSTGDAIGTLARQAGGFEPRVPRRRRSAVRG